MRVIKTYRKVGAFYIACEADFSTPIFSDGSLILAELLLGAPSRTVVMGQKICQQQNARDKLSAKNKNPWKQ